jgi:hypothetical protein
MALERPKTLEEFAALPVGPVYVRVKSTVDGRDVISIVPPSMKAIFHGDKDLISYVDSDGQCWALGRYVDGEWFRRRV